MYTFFFMPITYSTENFLTVCNRVLENIGERTAANSTGTPVARKVATAVRDAVKDIASYHDWDWAKDYVFLNSWSNENATLIGVEVVHGLSYGDSTNGFYPVPWVDNQTFDRFPLQPSTGDLDRPQMYTPHAGDKVRVNRYPTNGTQQNKFRAYVTLTLPAISNDSAFIPVPDFALPLVVYRSCMYMAVSHLDDAQAAGLWATQYESMLNRLRNRQRNLPTQRNNLFKRRV